MIVDTAIHKAEYSWAHQDIIKGLHVVMPGDAIAIYDLYVPDQHAGWGFWAEEFVYGPGPHEWTTETVISGLIRHDRMEQSDIDALGLD